MFKSLIDLHNNIVKVNKPLIKDFKDKKINMVKQNFNYFVETSKEDYKCLIKITDNIKNEHRIHFDFTSFVVKGGETPYRAKETRNENNVNITNKLS
jgi:expansin (peptidoglycan-binding protein)